MIVQCPFCFSENVTNLSIDSNDFICNDCGEDFQANNGVDIEEDDDIEEDSEADTDLEIPKQVRKENEDESKK